MPTPVNETHFWYVIARRDDPHRTPLEFAVSRRAARDLLFSSPNYFTEGRMPGEIFVIRRAKVVVYPS